jgi:hypothetical protein
MTPENTPESSAPAKPGEPSPEFRPLDTGPFRADTSADILRTEGSSGMAQAWVGKSLGKYQVSGALGQGGMGIVLKAHDPTIERDVAIKVLADHLAADASALGRFIAEARAAGKADPRPAVCQSGAPGGLLPDHRPRHGESPRRPVSVHGRDAGRSAGGGSYPFGTDADCSPQHERDRHGETPGSPIEADGFRRAAILVRCRRATPPRSDRAGRSSPRRRKRPRRPSNPRKAKRSWHNRSRRRDLRSCS